MPTLGSDDLDTIRRKYINDLYIAPVPNVSPQEALSAYNRAIRGVFITDDDLQAKADSVTRAYGEELAGVYSDDFRRLKFGGASDADADTAATALQNEAFFKLIRASVREDMMCDDGFAAYMPTGTQVPIFKSWLAQILRDRQFTRSRTTASLRSVPMERY